MEEKRFEWFNERFEELSSSEKINLYNEYCVDVRNENNFFTFDEEFFEISFNSAYDAARAVHYGTINWNDDYIRFNGYGNLESLSEYDLSLEADDYIDEIYEWGKFENYIDMSEFTSDDDEDLKIEGDI